VVAQSTAALPASADAAAVTASSTAEPVFDLEQVEHQTILAALKYFQGNVSHAAKALGLTRGALYRRLEKYGL